MAQLTYDLYQPVGIEGGLFDLNPMDVISPVATEAIKPGLGLVKISGEEILKVALPSSTSIPAQFLGVAVFIQQLMNNFVVPGESTTRTYVQGDAVTVVTRGRIWVTVEQDVTVDSPVYVRTVATVGNPQLGGFRADSDTSRAILLSNAKFYRGASAGGLAVLELR